jgi:CRISPR-associated protein Cas1
MAQQFAFARCDFIEGAWNRIGRLSKLNISPVQPISRFRESIKSASSASAIMEHEALCAKALYATLAKSFGLSHFTREHGKRDDADLANSFLDHGNYLAYGFAATVLWVLGIPHSLPLSHGMTRRGALVFDVADLIKDGIVMPLAFACASEGIPDSDFRGECLREMRRLKALAFMFETVKSVATRVVA